MTTAIVSFPVLAYGTTNAQTVDEEHDLPVYPLKHLLGPRKSLLGAPASPLSRSGWAEGVRALGAGEVMRISGGTTIGAMNPRWLFPSRGFYRLRNKLAHLHQSPEEENERFNAVAFNVADEALLALNAARIMPRDIVISADATVDFYFRTEAPGRFGSLSIDDDGDIVALVVDRPSGNPAQVWQIAPGQVAEAAKTITDFLQS